MIRSIADTITGKFPPQPKEGCEVAQGSSQAFVSAIQPFLPMDRKRSTPPELSHDVTAARAREIWYARNCPIGQDEEIWLEAERQLTTEQQAQADPKSKPAGETAVDIDQRQLADDLADFGAAQDRSATSIDPTR
jgi:hypothetical protein